MNKNLAWKNILIISFVVIAAWTLYPPKETLKPGIDLAGGTSLIYQIDSAGLNEDEVKGLSGRMITILRRRIDPANIQNLIWRSQGNTRFEIQMPLASTEARKKRQLFESALSQLLAENVNPAVIMRSLLKPAEQRTEDFGKFAQNYDVRRDILLQLADTYDAYTTLRTKSDKLAEQLKDAETKITDAEINIALVKIKLHEWARLDEEKLTEALKEIPDSNDNIELLTEYVKTHAEWADVVERLIDPETGATLQYEMAKKNLDKLNLTQDQIDYILEMDPKSANRKKAVTELKAEFADRKEKIEKVMLAYDQYYPHRGGLDDPKDLQRMLKGAGILEFRILPTAGQGELTDDEIGVYMERLKEKGPKYASDSRYVWCEIENGPQWSAGDAQQRPSIVAQFGNRYYVLASDKKDQMMVHAADGKDWKLKKASSGRESRTGRRAIDFVLDERAGKKFAAVTGKNIGSPLCILLDGLAISAPNINSRISTRGQITGSFSQTEQGDMVNKLNAGSLPARLIEQPISVKTIGPSIGADNRDKGIKAAQIGFIAVIVCMTVYYTLAGSIASLALMLNMLFVLAIMALVRANFTLPGIAGIILTIGMSVDANVLIFERIREEQKKGSSLRIAIKNGYQKAFRTILDANLTTFITAAILFWVASEEIKGFAIVLMLGIVSSMFTALFVTRTNFDSLLSKRLIKDHLLMLRLIHKPNINWMKARPVFIFVSTLLIVAGLAVFFTRDSVENNKYDIEFTGGTSAQVNFKENVTITRQQVEDAIRDAGKKLKNPALTAANVYSIGKSNRQYEINTTETNKVKVVITFKQAGQHTPAAIAAAISDKLSNLLITPHDANPTAFVITTSQPNKSVVEAVLAEAFEDTEISEPQIDQVVNNAIINAFGNKLQIQLNLEPKIVGSEKISEELIESYPELTDFLGGLKIDCQIAKVATGDQIERRFKDLRFKPDTRDMKWYNYKILDSELNPVETDKLLNSFVYVSVEPEAGFGQLTDDQWQRFTETETAKIISAASRETSLPRVTQINPSIGKEAKTQALIAIVLSLFAIIAYIWVRFGDVRYGVAAIVALVHDVCITLGAVTACTYLAPTAFGQMILIGDFKINLAMIAAFLTLIGYSLNDTIVVFDRIRENRKKAQLKPNIINDSINQTISRTLLTSLTTFIVVLTMYIFGGQALRGFTFAIGFGIIIGTYSSIAIAAPILLIGTKNKKQR